MKLFLNSDLSRDFRIKFIKTNFRSKNADKGKIDITSAFWVSIFHLKLIWNLIFFRPTVVYYPITATAAGWIARDAPCLIFCRLLGARTVIHLRGGHLQVNFRNFSPFVKWLVTRSCSQVSLALVQAECLRDQFLGIVAEASIRVLPQAIDTKEYDDGGLSASPGEESVLFLGNMSYSKGYCDLLRALPMVVEAIPEVRFIFCGMIVEENATGVLFNQVSGQKLRHQSAFSAHREVQTSSYRKHYEWRGVVSGHEKLQLLRSCSLVALPSYSEGFSRALLEAMSIGKPIVYTPVGAHREFIANGVHGLMVMPGNVGDLATAIISLLSNECLRRRIGSNNYKYVREKFDIRLVSKQLGALLLEAARNGRTVV